MGPFRFSVLTSRQPLQPHRIPIPYPQPNASPENYLQNEIKVIQSDTLARRIANRLGPLPEPKPGALGNLLRSMEKMLGASSAKRVPDPIKIAEQRVRGIKSALTVRTSLQSQVVDVFFDAPDPALAAKGANAAASEFIGMNREARTQLVQDTTE